MAIHDDVAESLPDPPPAAPAPRAAAIQRALRRFDEGAAGTRAGTRPPREVPSKPWLSPAGRRYAGALASIALVALVGVPLALQSVEEPPVTVREERMAAAPAAPPAPATMADQSEAPDVASRSAAAPAAEAEPPARAEAADTGSLPDRVAFAEAARPVPAPAEKATARRSAPEPGPPASRDADPAGEIMVSGSRIAAPALAPSADALAAEGAIVATGSRAAAPRGDWNQCTVDDPGRSLAGCRHLVDPAATGAAGRAAAHLADGLTLAWQGELADAITAFDRAIAIAPRYSFAYLNRGLAHRRNGDLDRALADLNRAVRSAPRSARAYYNRSLVLRQQGAKARAQADEKRAVALDSRYAAVVQ